MIHITNHSKDRKMENMQSINTNPLTNKFCISSAKKNRVCKKCYAIRQIGMYSNMVKPLQNNSDILSTKRLNTHDVPIINAIIFRFNSFGELINKQHLENLFLIAYYNPKTMFTLWTKRTTLVQKYVAKYGKPDNIILIHSSYEINKKEELPDYFDKVFTVYDKWYVSGRDLKINCFRHCIDCKLCYTKNSIVHIDELIK